MSIKEMIRDHPQVGADYTEELGEAVKHALYCAAICNSCADACSAEEMAMAECIRLCSDCSDICTATYRVASRRTGGNVLIIKEILRTCIAACNAGEAECAKHDNPHCQRCAQMCRECSDDCQRALDAMEA